MNEYRQTNPMSLGWLDNNQEEQEKIKVLLSLLQEKGTLDELGIGTIRDAFSNMLFPGITTIQTRAKYLVILLYLFQEADKEARKAARKNSPITRQALGEFLNKKQDDLVDVFKANGLNERGVIGIRARNVVQKPTFIYWGALTTFRMVNPNLSFSQMCDSICYNAVEAEQKRNSSVKDNKNNDDYFEDAPDACLDYPDLYSPVTWNHDNWREGLNMNLTYDEAKFICSKILASPSSKNSALAQLLKYCRDNGISCDFKNFDEIPEVALDENMKQVFQLAKAFRNFIYGAHIAYNYLLSDRNDAFLKDAFDDWKNQDFNLVPLDEILLKTKASTQQKAFLKELLSFAKSGEWKRFEERVQQREKELKGNRRKIGSFDYEKTPYQSPYNSVEAVSWMKLDYRSYRAGGIIRDILEGLNNTRR
ncbi:MAG: hypothetical protein IJG38_07980 [Thermoguttaceae bacterium]|nr:hypothetical protein [Thermoguttaceae bacterium]